MKGGASYVVVSSPYSTTTEKITSMARQSRPGRGAGAWKEKDSEYIV